MKGHILIVATAALVAASPQFVPGARAADPSADTQPGFVPDTGQINPGHAAQPWRAAPPLPQAGQPAQDDARAALMMPDNGAPSAGQNNIQNTSQPNPPAPSGGLSASGNASGPIGATLQTMPAKFSKRNDLLDQVPVMAWPLPLNAQQRQQIYQTVMSDKSSAPPDAAQLKPASSLSFEQRQDLHPLPAAVAAIDGLQGLQYVKGQDKVLLVRPSSGIVVDEVSK